MTPPGPISTDRSAEPRSPDPDRRRLSARTLRHAVPISLARNTPVAEEFETPWKIYEFTTKALPFDKSARLN